MKKTLLLCCLLATTFNSGLFAQIIGPARVGCGTSATFTTPANAFTYHWDFNPNYVSVVPSGLPPSTCIIGPPSGTVCPTPLNTPSYGCFLQQNSGPDGPQYFYYVTEYNTGNLWCYAWGPGGPLSLVPPTKTLIGTYPGTHLEGVDIMSDGLDYYALVVNSSSLIELYLGNSSNLGNPVSAVNTNFVSLPSYIYWPHQITGKFFDGGWHAFIGDRNGTLDRLDFGPSIGSLMTTPLFTSLPNVGGVSNPCNFTLYQQGGNWYALISNLISNSISLYSFGTDLMNTPTGTAEPATTLLDLPRAMSIYPDCFGNLIALQFNETGHLIQLTFPGGDITNPCTYNDLGPTGLSTCGSGAPAAFNNGYYYMVPEFGSGDIYMFDPLIPLLVPNAYDDYMWLSQNNTFTLPGLYDISLFYDMGRPSGPSVACSQVNVVCNVPCYEQGQMAVTQSTLNPCTYTACVGIGTANTITGYTWEVEPGSVIVTDPSSLPNDCFTFSTIPGTVYTVTVTVHIVDANLNCCTAVFTDTVSCGDQSGGPLDPSGSGGGRRESPATGTDNTNGTGNDIQIFPNPTNNVVTVTSGNGSISNVQVFDINGKKVGNYSYTNVQTTNISLVGFPPGNYFFKVNNSTSKVVVKLE